MELTQPIGKELIAVLASYALGSISVGYYLVLLRTGQDIRAMGSGAAGSSNVSRALGVPGFLVTFLGDMAKGAAVVWAARYFELDSWVVVPAVITVVAGQIWPVQLGFRGGKGLATLFGAMLVYDYRIAGIAVTLLGLTLAITRRPTLSAMFAVAMAPGIGAIIGQPSEDVIGISVLVFLIWIAHRTNIRTEINHGRRQPSVKE